MFIVIRVDSSIQIGAGHIMRCLTLAKELRDRGAEVLFICRDIIGNMVKIIEDSHIQVMLLPLLAKNGNNDINEPEKILDTWEKDAAETICAIGNRAVDWCIVDHYGLDERWHKKIRKHVKNIFVIDDVANRKFDCDILLDQTFGRKDTDYQANIPDACQLLLGSEYALLRPDFKSLRPTAMKKRGNVTEIRKILIAMGGTDVKNITSIALNAIEIQDWKGKPVVDVVLSSNAPNVANIKKQALNTGIMVNVHLDAPNMAELMLDADVAIGAGGSTSWERCCLGLPTIVVITANNQSEIVNNLERAGAIVSLGRSDNISVESIAKTLDVLITSQSRAIDMSMEAFNICHGKGAEICADKIYSYEI